MGFTPHCHIRSRNKTHRRSAALLEALESRVLLAADLPLTGFEVPQHYLMLPAGYLTPRQPGSALDVARNYLAAHAPDLGLTVQDVLTAAVSSQYTDADTGLTHIYLSQQFGELQVENTSLTVTVTAAGQILNVAGGFYPAAADHVIATAAPISASLATRGAAALGLTVGNSLVISSQPGGEQWTVLSNASLSLDAITARLAYLPTAEGLRLVWNMPLRTPDNQHWYDLSVDAQTGTALQAFDWVDHATYDVFALPTESPADGSRSLVTDPHDPAASPFGWHDTNAVAGPEFTDTRGNNVSAQDDTDANNTGGNRPSGGATLNFDFPLDLTQSPSAYQSAAITNLFYWNNICHDIHYKYGFTEAAGNFQVTNYTGLGLGNDAVQADAQDGSGTNNANFATPPDGSAPRMQMYLFTYTSPSRDGDLDTMIMVHEYGHGVSNRLTGGPANANALDALQSGGMGEGWSDFWGLMFTQKPTDTKTAAYPAGTYVLGQATTGAGIRRYPYSFDMTKDPLTITNYNTDSSHEVHNTGEIWSTTLWDLNWLLIDKYGYNSNLAQGYTGAGSAGNILALKLVMDALKIQPANPSFKDARDAILQADQVLTGGANAFEIWTAFARRGMGASFGDSSSSAISVTPAFDMPTAFLAPSITSQSPIGTSTTPVSSLNLLFSAVMDPTSFDIASDVISFTGPGGVDLKPTITRFSWTNSNQTLRLDFAATTADGLYSFTVGPQILSASGKLMDQNHNGTGGEAGDSYTGTFRFDALVGQVIGTLPAPASLVTLPMTTLDLLFNEPIDPASLGTSDLTLNQGSVISALQIAPATVRYTLSGIITEGTLNVSMAAGAVTDMAGNPIQAYSASYALDAGVTAFPTPLTAKLPVGGMIYDPTVAGTIGTVADTDAYTLVLDAGQTLSVSVLPGTGLAPTLTVLDPVGNALGTVSGTVTGREVILQTLPVASAGTYTVIVGSATGTGAYSVAVTLNAALEAEAHAGPTNDSLATAQDLTSSFIQLGAGGSRGAVIGSLPSATGMILASEDWESGTIGSAWTTYRSDASDGRIQVTSAYGSASSPYALLMDTLSSTNLYNLNEATWSVNLAGLSAATLTFYQSNNNDEADALAATWTGHANGDGVSFSADGTTWYRLWQGDSTYTGTAFTLVTVDLATAATAAGIPLSSITRIKFQQYDNFALTTDGRGYDKIAITTPAPQDDYYKVTLNAGDSLSLAVMHQGTTSGETLRLYDAAGNLLAMSAADATNVDQSLRNFIAPAGGTYYVRASGASVTYDLVLTKNADFDLEANDTRATAQPVLSSPVSGLRTVLGNITGNADNFSVTLTAGVPITLQTLTPSDGPGEYTNTLDPRIRLLDSSGALVASDDGSAADGRNALLNFTPSSSGIYYVEVSTQAATAGDYILQLRGVTAPPASLAVTSISPANASTLFVVPTQATVVFSGNLLLASLQPSDLRIDGIPATAVTASNGRTAVFTLPGGITSGTHTLTINAGDVSDVAGNPVAAFTSTFTLDITPPRISSSSIQEGDIRAPGTLSLVLAFTRPMLAANLDATDFTLKGNLLNITYAAASSVWSAGNTVLTLNYAALPEDSYSATLLSGDGRFEDANGIDLDGEPNFPTPPNLSGNGVPGGNFVVNFSLDRPTSAFSTPLLAQAPVGSLIYSGSTSAMIATSADTDALTIKLDAGQTFSVVIHPTTAALRPAVSVTAPDGATLASATAAAANQDVVLQTLTAASTGIYTITTSGAALTVGASTVQLVLNAAVESEQHNGPANETPATAQILGPGVSLGNAASVTSVLGALGATTSTDFYAFTLAPNQPVSLALMRLTGSNLPSLSLLDANGNGNPIAVGGPSAINVSASIDSFVSTSGGTFYARVSGSGMDYSLVVTIGAALDLESNGTIATAQVPGAASTILGYVQGGGGLGRLYVHENANDIKELNPLTGTVIRTFPAPTTTSVGPDFGLATTSTSLLAGGDPSSPIYELNPDTGAVIRTIPNPSIAISGLAFMNNEIYALTDAVSGKITVIDYLTGAVKRTITASPIYEGLGSSGTNLYGSSGNSLYRIDPQTGAVTLLATLANASGIEGVGVVADELFVCSGNGVTVYNLSTLAYKRTFTAGISDMEGVGADGGSSLDEDLFAINVTAGTPITLRTSTPGDDSGEFANLLNPMLELYDASGTKVASDDDGAPDARNALLTFTPTTSGIMYAKVRPSTTASSSGGEYILTLAGVAPVTLPFSVSAVNPANASVATASFSQVTLTFSGPILQTTLQASDLRLDGLPLSSVTLSGDRTALFSVPTLTNGPHTLAITAGDILDIHGTPLSPFTSTFTLDVSSPKIVGSSIQEGGVLAPGTLVYSATFSKPMLASNLDSTDFSLKGNLRNLTYSPLSYAYSAGNTVLTITYSALPEDNYSLTLLSGNGRFEDAAGADLDGEPHFPMPPNTSGDGVQGGDFAVNFSLDAPVAPFPVPLTALSPLGSLIYSGTTSGVIATPADTDSFTLNLDAGQVLTLIMHATSATFRPAFSITGPAGATLATASAPAPGQDALLQSLAITTPGIYTLSAASADTTSGMFTLQAILNAAAEAEQHNGPANDTLATAQDLNPTALPLGLNMSVTSVLGTLGTSSTDFYSFTLNAGQPASFALSRLAGANTPALNLYNSLGTLLATGTASSNTQAAIARFVPTATGTYYAKVTGTSLDYALAVTRGAAFDLEPNDSFATAQLVDGNRGVLGHLSGATGSLALTAAATGWWDVTGAHTSGNSNYIVGSDNGTQYRDYFVFDLTGVAQTIQSARLNIFNPSTGFNSTDPSETLQFYDVSTPVAALTAGGSAQTAIYSDLGTGTVYGSRTVSTSDNATIVATDLNTDAINAINAINATRGSQIAFGGALTSIAGTAIQELFAYSGNSADVKQLVLGLGQAVDWYSLVAGAPGTHWSLSTATPADGAGQFVNLFNPHIEIYDPFGNLVASGITGPDGRNESIDYVTAVPGLFRVRVSSEGGTTGEYLLNLPVPPLMLAAPAHAAEDTGIVMGSVSLQQAPAADLVISLSSSDPARLSVPLTVTLPAGSNSVQIPMKTIDNGLLDGAATITLTATVPGYTPGTTTVIVHDDDSATLSITLPATAAEGGGPLSGTVTSSAAPAVDTVVHLLSANPARITVPATVLLKAGETTAAFTATVVNNTAIDGLQTVQVTASVENWTTGASTVAVSDDDTGVAGRHIFYQGSPLYGASHDLAIAPDKAALLPGHTASFANYTSYAAGINGLMIDIAGPLGPLTAADFLFKVGGASPADTDPGLWPAAPAPTSIVLRPGAGDGGSTRVEILWDEQAIRNQWLQVTVIASARTAMTANDVFYFGNAVGETGDSPADAQVTPADETAVRAHPATLLDPAPLANPYDFNRDGKADAFDQLLSRAACTDAAHALVLLTAPANLAAENAAPENLATPPAIRLAPAVALGPNRWIPFLAALTTHSPAAFPSLLPIVPAIISPSLSIPGTPTRLKAVSGNLIKLSRQPLAKLRQPSKFHPGSESRF